VLYMRVEGQVVGIKNRWSAHRAPHEANHHVRGPMFACHFDRQQAVLVHSLDARGISKYRGFHSCTASVHSAKSVLMIASSSQDSLLSKIVLKTVKGCHLDSRSMMFTPCDGFGLV